MIELRHLSTGLSVASVLGVLLALTWDDIFGQPVPSNSSYTPPETGYAPASDIKTVQEIIELNQNDLRQKAQVHGVDSACFNLIMGEIDSLRSRLNFLAQLYTADGHITPEEHAVLQGVIHQIEQKMGAAANLIPQPPYGVPKTFCT